ncbi:MAG: helix-turn-helix transcriptional regulator [Caulobacter sp.]|nr:helix-turn-helix transcriptional regulator [Caulobacter sp.]
MPARANSAPREGAGVRTKALAAAGALLAEVGAEELSLRLIADRAGIGLASIYHYFDGKDALLVSLALAGLEDLRRDVLALQRSPEYSSPMRGGARAFFGFAQARPRLFSLMFSERLLVNHESLRAAEQQVVLAYKTAVEADDRIPPRHQENAAYALWALGRGMAAIIASYPSGEIPPELLEKLFAGGAYLIDHPE